ncbi:hypothetical protein FDF26_13820 [Clostridium botulinum]|nr:hypothetical protein [Clostridium botulinum]
MERNKIELLLGETHFKEMLLTQLYSWELILKKRNLSNKTIDRKIKNITDFMAHLNVIRLNNKNKLFKFNNLGIILFEYVRDGYFGSGENLDNSGTSPYRQNIYYNIAEGLNYIYENMNNNKQIIKPLTDSEKEILNEISHNKWFKVCSIKNDESETFYDSVQVQLIEKLDIKVYFDDKNLPYVLSHELAETIGKNNKDIMKNIRLINKRFNGRKISLVSELSNFNMLEELYKDPKGELRPTYKIYKDLLLVYLLGLNGDKYFDFKIQYVDAFNYIEIQYNKSLIEKGKLKESFFNMYNEIRQRNRDLLITDFNKKCKRKAS